MVVLGDNDEKNDMEKYRSANQTEETKLELPIFLLCKITIFIMILEIDLLLLFFG